MDMTVLAGLGRYLLSWIGLWLISQGYVTEADWQTASGSLTAIGSVLLTAGPPLYWVIVGARKARDRGR